ncbi:MAG: thioredoxin family protein [Chitinophagaceae bacterium]|nr:thioredoxin family protein [Chitinophagaceae bacterium]
MKRYGIFLLAFFAVLKARTQQQMPTPSQSCEYIVLNERPNEKSIIGFITRATLENDTTFTWYQQSLKNYRPDSSVVETLRHASPDLHFLVFLGTWCSDSHYIIPKFFSIVKSAGFAEEKITLIGVDRSKKTLYHLTDAFQVKNVPTLIVLHKGKEAGRVVEYGTSGKFDKDLADILKTLH